MPRQKRIEYKGALYHVMARGNRGSCIVEDDKDRECFLETLEEVVKQTGWQVYAFALMNNHYHVALKTPEPNLVKGMTWFQGTFTKRHNARHQRYGHLFAGRYKALNVEDGGYLTTLIHYIHLNPLRAGLVSPTAEGLQSYKWSSLQDYVLPPKKRRSFIASEKGLGHLQKEDSARGRERILEQTLSLAGAEVEAFEQGVKGGWVLGSEEFHKKLASQLKIGAGNDRKGLMKEQLKDHGEHTAQEIIQAGLAFYQLKREDLPSLKKSDWRKASIALHIKNTTTLDLKWIAKALEMGHTSGVTQSVYKLKEKLDSGRIDGEDLFRG